jgi:hypothetical protein
VAVERDGVIVEQVRRSQVGAAAEPARHRAVIAFDLGCVL